MTVNILGISKVDNKKKCISTSKIDVGIQDLKKRNYSLRRRYKRKYRAGSDLDKMILYFQSIT